MMGIPRAALLLGLAGVLPFAASVLGTLILTESWAQAARWSLALYGLTILSFMSGCIWAFAAKSQDVTGYALSVLPALLGYFSFALGFMGAPSPTAPLLPMALAFVALLALDRRALMLGQAPEWWMRLRVLLTSLVVVCLLIGAFA